jgi:hypothetical protein
MEGYLKKNLPLLHMMSDSDLSSRSLVLQIMVSSCSGAVSL